MSRFSPHFPAVLVALVLCVFTTSVLTLGERSALNFAGIATPHLDDQLYYLARARDVVDGHPFLGNPYLAEHKDLPPLQVWLPDYLLAAPLGWLGVSVTTGYLVYAGIFGAILFLLTYSIALLLTRSRLTSLLTALLLHGVLFEVTLARLPSPGFNFIFFELLLLALLLYLRYGKRRFAALAAASLGFLFYLYPYFWTFWVVALAVFLILGYVTKRDIRFRGVLLLSLVGCMLGAEYLWATIEASHLPTYHETLERIGLIASHFPSGYLIVALTLLVLGLTAVLWRKRRITLDPPMLLMLSMVSAGAIVVNQHVITGANLEFSSHYQLPSIYSVVLAGALLSRSLVLPLRKWRRVVVSACVLAVVALVGYSAYHFTVLARAFSPEDVQIQRYAPIFSWLSANTKKDEVVFANELASQYIPVYTPDNVYDSGYAILFFLPNTEAEERFLITHYWDTVTPEFIAAHERSIFGAGYLDDYAHVQSKNMLRKLFHLPPIVTERIPTAAIARVTTEAKAIHALSFQNALATYRADYIVWDRVADPSWKIDRYPFVTLEYRSGDIAIYRVNAGPR